MSKPKIQIENVQVVGGTVHFDATVAGYSVKLAMPEEFVEDEIGSADRTRVLSYFLEHDDDIQAAAWKAAYDHSTRDKGPGDAPGAVPYIGGVRVPFDKIQPRD